MARSNEQRLTLLQDTRDRIEDALYRTASTADVISYTTPEGRKVDRNRKQAQSELDDIERRIQKLELRQNGAASNRAVLRRRA